MSIRNLRNFWVFADIDGRKTPLSGGPKKRDGGMFIELYQREHGKSVEVLKIECIAEKDKLYTYVYIDDALVKVIETNR